MVEEPIVVIWADQMVELETESKYRYYMDSEIVEPRWWTNIMPYRGLSSGAGDYLPIKKIIVAYKRDV